MVSLRGEAMRVDVVSRSPRSIDLFAKGDAINEEADLGQPLELAE